MIPCIGCGACCRDEIELVPNDNVPELLVRMVDGKRLMLKANNTVWCAALDRVQRKCLIYDRRPQVCRDFERGGLGCHKAINLVGRIHG